MVTKAKTDYGFSKEQQKGLAAIIRAAAVQSVEQHSHEDGDDTDEWDDTIPRAEANKSKKRRFVAIAKGENKRKKDLEVRFVQGVLGNQQ